MRYRNSLRSRGCTVVAGPWVPCSGRATGTVKILYKDDNRYVMSIGLVTNERQLDYNWGVTKNGRSTSIASNLMGRAYRSWTYGVSMTYIEDGSVWGRGRNMFTQGDTVTVTLDNCQLSFFVNGELRDTFDLLGSMPPPGWNLTSRSTHPPLDPTTEVTLAVSLGLNDQVRFE